ncbi:hypothetical protein [Xanthocytophaga flava]|uniref:hypothetical protein n=1 Tax=Xanthocytophaga flava TaxID=3048013 RepID=UPI0028D5DA8E|nr:hypothetical protein [Xanthocytophaga flavus]MDJ1473031.1 hypothetical protein [Xanthocytophaga flavus]
MKPILIYSLFLLVFIHSISCLTKNKYKEKQNGFTISKSCLCSPLKGWNNTFRKNIVYKYDAKPIKINGLSYHPITFDYKGAGKGPSGYLRASQDTLFWLDTSWETRSTFFHDKLKKEQIFALLSPNLGYTWELYTSSFLLGSSKIELKEVIRLKNEEIYTYEFNVENISTLGSDYLIIQKMTISKKRGIINLTLQSSSGATSLCTF